NHLGDLHGVGLRSSQLRQVSVSPHDNGVPKWLGLSSTPAACLLRCIDQVPLCDSPVMIDRDSLMATLSPRLLLDIDLNVSRPEQYWRLRDDMPKHKIAEFRRRSIANSFKEVIFSDPHTLQEWLSSDHAKARIA